MKITKRIDVPTGSILIGDGAHGDLEFLSIGDYGKEVNLKCDAIGLHEAPGRVEHQEMLPLTEKWVITISTQYGCSMGCTFCDVPRVGPGRNATHADLVGQVYAGMSLHPEICWSERLNVHFARMGEPTFNPAVLSATVELAAMSGFNIHPVVSTMMPARNHHLAEFIASWMRIKNGLMRGEAGLQLSINSTSELARQAMFNGSALPLDEIGAVMSLAELPDGRKITLNFAVADWAIDPDVLLRNFSPDEYIIKLTPMHKTARATEAGIKTTGDYAQYHPYEHHEEALKAAGYGVLVFIASEAEDLGRITCGNAILSGSMPECEHTVFP